MDYSDILGEEYQDPLDFISITREGVRKSVLMKLKQSMGLNQKEIADLLHVTPRTLQRLGEREKLPSTTSGILLEITKVFKMAVDVLGSEDKAREWLRTPVLALSEETPINLLDTPTGISWVSTILMHIEHGVYS